MHKTICLWSRFSAAWGIDFTELEQVYSCTEGCFGLVHVVGRGGRPRLDTEQDTYYVSLTPIGLQHSHVKPRSEQEAARAAHGLLHGLLALHKVRCCFMAAESSWVWCNMKHGVSAFHQL